MINKLLATSILLSFLACSTTKTSSIPPQLQVDPGDKVERRPLPPDPAQEALPSPFMSEVIAPLEKGSCLGKSDPCPPESGLFVSEGRAVRDGLFRLRYKELRKLYEADRTVWVVQRELYETGISNLNYLLINSSPTWYQRHSLEIGLIGGFILGSVVVLSLEKAIK